MKKCLIIAVSYDQPLVINACVNPNKLHKLYIGRVWQKERLLQCLAWEVEPYQNYDRGENFIREKGRKRRRSMTRKTRGGGVVGGEGGEGGEGGREWGGGGEGGQSVMLLCTWEATAPHCVQIHLHTMSFPDLYSPNTWQIFAIEIKTWMAAAVECKGETDHHQEQLAAPSFHREVAWSFKLRSWLLKLG